MKSASRNKLLHCFRPMVDMDAATQPEPEPNLGFNYLILEKTDDDDYNCSKAVPEKKRTFSRVVKAVFFETILAKRVRDKTKSCSFSNSTKELRSPDSLVPKNRITSSSSSSSSSSSTSESAKQKHQKTNNEDGRRNIAEKVKDETNRRHNMGLYLLLISLAITVLCGRFLAILFTSGWLCVVFAGQRERKSRRRETRKGHNGWLA